MLVDPEKLSIENVPRHVLGRRYVSRYKVNGVKQEILDRNPHARVVTIRKKAQQAEEKLADVDLFIICVDSEPARHSINMLARRLGKPAVTAGVYERATAGDIFITQPSSGACYSCIASELVAEEAQEAAPAEKLDYGAVRPDGTLQGQPGLGLHVAHIALLQADIALRQLLAGTDNPMSPLPGNVLFVANEPIVGQDEQGGELKLEIGGTRWTTVYRKPTCRVCGISQQTIAQTVDDLLKQL